MANFTTQIVLLFSLLSFIYGAMAGVFNGTANMLLKGAFTGVAAHIYNVKVSYVRKSNSLELDLDLEAVIPDVVETYVALDLFIDGRHYSWMKDGGGTTCIIDPNLCPLPLDQIAHIHVSGNPEFNIPDDVWSRPDPIGTFTFSIAASNDAYGEVPGTLTHVNFVSAEAVGGSGHSKGAAWVSGLVTVGLLAGAGVASLLGSGTTALPAATGGGGGAGTAAAVGVHSAVLPNLSSSGAAVVAAVAVAGGVQGIVAGKAANPDGSPAHATSADAAEAGQNTSAPSAKPGAGAGGQHGPPLSLMDPITLFLQFQFISTTGLLSLNYPPLYRGFTVNFAWANFILPIPGFIKGAARARRCQFIGSGGIAIYAAQLGINPQDVFLVAWFAFLCICAILTGLYLLTLLFLQVKVMAAGESENRDVWVERQRRWGQMTSNNSLRLMSLGLGSLTTLIFYQWTQQCTAGSTTFATVFALFVIISSLTVVTFLILRLARSPEGIQQLYNAESTPARRWSSLYCTLKETKINFLMLYLFATLIRRAIVGFLQRSGLAQNILLILFESAMGIFLFMYKPYCSEGYNRLNYGLAGLNVVSMCLSLPFNNVVHLKPESAWALAIVHIALHSLVALALAILTVIKLGWGILWCRSKHIAFESKKPKRKLFGRKTASNSDMTVNEKGDVSVDSPEMVNGAPRPVQ